jgi:hypothetical protein
MKNTSETMYIMSIQTDEATENCIIIKYFLQQAAFDLRKCRSPAVFLPNCRLSKRTSRSRGSRSHRTRLDRRQRHSDKN